MRAITLRWPLCVAGILIALWEFSPLAQAETRKSNPQTELEVTQQRMDAARNKKQQLQSQQENIAQEQQALQEKLVERTAALQQAEQALTKIESELTELTHQREAKAAELKKRQDSLDALMRAALRLGQVPPETALVLPGDTESSMEAARIIGLMSESVRVEGEKIAADIRDLKAIEDKRIARRKDAAAQKESLASERSALNTELKRRQALMINLKRESDASSRELAELAKKAESLKSLLSSLEEDRSTRKSRQKELESGSEITQDAVKPSGKKGKLRSFASAKGKIRPPAAGKIIREFGAEMGPNETSKGMTILTRENAQVSAPFDSEVVFTGPFLTYGRIVILRHKDGFHTLLAGFSHIDVQVGQFLLEGEPIGAMGDNDAGRRLYVELRERTQPINPRPWFKS